MSSHWPSSYCERSGQILGRSTSKVTRLTKVNTCRYLSCSAAEHTYKDPGACYVLGSNRFLLCLLFALGPHLHLTSPCAHRPAFTVEYSSMTAVLSVTRIISHSRPSSSFPPPPRGAFCKELYLLASNLPSRQPLRFAVLGLLHQTAIFALRRGWVWGKG